MEKKIEMNKQDKDFISNEFLYRQLYLIRRFEETVVDNFPKGVFYGTTHAYIGQEANAVGVLVHLQTGDIVFSNHRCHGHFLAYGGDARSLFAELMGKSTGICAGRGGSQHLQWKNFYSNGIQGGIVPVAAGMALAEKLKGTRAVSVAFLGDGTMGEGVVYETFNMASLWQIPILFVVENNHIAQTTPIHSALAGSLSARFQAFGIETVELDTSDVLEITEKAKTLLDYVKGSVAPRALVLNTRRFAPHSKGDDTRAPEELHQMRATRDPIAIHGQRIGEYERNAISSEVDEFILQAFHQAKEDPFAQEASQ